MYEIGPWKVKVPEDIEIYSPDQRTAELIPHSQYGYRFKLDATLAEKSDLLCKAGPPQWTLGDSLGSEEY